MATRPDTRTAVRTPVQKAAAAVGAVFVLVGVLGFIPGITTDYGTMGFAGHESEADGERAAARVDHRVAEHVGTRTRTGEHTTCLVHLEDGLVEGTVFEHRTQMHR